ncbi:MAG: hypothetical protein CVU91_10995 [Firmicutes bacterium HGW-Firmicutes-16]|nr:MAG: hypothetical protein CVU91_10995 [Firmicutes bacterium HGW-Firmicutes-16]
MNGDKEDGLDLAYQAFEQDPDGLFIRDTYIVALHENDKSDETDAQIKEYLAKGNTLDEDTQAYLDGKISLRDLYIDE